MVPQTIYSVIYFCFKQQLSRLIKYTTRLFLGRRSFMTLSYTFETRRKRDSGKWCPRLRAFLLPQNTKCLSYGDALSETIANSTLKFRERVQECPHSGHTITEQRIRAKRRPAISQQSDKCVCHGARRSHRRVFPLLRFLLPLHDSFRVSSSVSSLPSSDITELHGKGTPCLAFDTQKLTFSAFQLKIRESDSRPPSLLVARQFLYRLFHSLIFCSKIRNLLNISGIRMYSLMI